MENETAIKAAKDIASAVSGFDIEDTSVKKETGKSITLTQTLPDNKRRQYVTAVNKFLSNVISGKIYSYLPVFTLLF